jgi:hypothetical protein
MLLVITGFNVPNIPDLAISGTLKWVLHEFCHSNMFQDYPTQYACLIHGFITCDVDQAWERSSQSVLHEPPLFLNSMHPEHSQVLCSGVLLDTIYLWIPRVYCIFPYPALESAIFLEFLIPFIKKWVGN